MSPLSHEDKRRTRRVEPDNAGARIQRRRQGARPAGIVALAEWRNLPALPEPQRKAHLQAPAQSDEQIQSPQGRSQMRRLPQTVHRYRRHNFRGFAPANQQMAHGNFHHLLQ